MATTITSKEALFRYLLRLGDNSLMQSQRLSEWCSRGPILEEDLAMSNIALDYLGRTRALLDYAGKVEGQNRTEDDLAFKRGERAFFNNLICELPKGDFAFTMARQLIIASFESLLFEALSISTDETIAAIAAKTLKEVKYHFIHARDWCLRLGKGTDLSHEKLQNAINDLWMYTGELFEMDENDETLISAGIAFDLIALQSKWKAQMAKVLQEAAIELPIDGYMQTGSRKGIHTEYLGHMLTEMQYLQRAYPDATW